MPPKQSKEQTASGCKDCGNSSCTCAGNCTCHAGKCVCDASAKGRAKTDGVGGISAHSGSDDKVGNCGCKDSGCKCGTGCACVGANGRCGCDCGGASGGASGSAEMPLPGAKGKTGAK